MKTIEEYFAMLSEYLVQPAAHLLPWQGDAAEVDIDEYEILWESQYVRMAMTELDVANARLRKKLADWQMKNTEWDEEIVKEFTATELGKSIAKENQDERNQ